jgi:cytoskeleton protein RodZ
MDSVNPPMSAATVPPPGPGRMLQKARQDLRLAPEDVAQILHLSSRQVVALEQDDYKSLPGPTYVRGYLRSYAQLLGLAPEKILESYSALTIAPKPLAMPRSAPPSQATSGDRLVKLGTVAVVAVVLGLVYLWWRNQDEMPRHAALSTPAAPSETSSSAAGPAGLTQDVATSPANHAVLTETRPAVAPPPEPSRPAASAAAPARDALTAENSAPAAKAGAAGHVMVSGMVLNVSPGVPPKPQNSTAAPRTDRALAPARQAADMPADAPRSRLVLQAVQESWADVRDAGDNKLLYENIPAGRRVTIEGVAPFNVFLGNADGVRVEFNGKNFDIARYKRGQVARFTLGENPAVNN